MSNVLIGIIGVILFIGLALAGAMILGDDFRTASASSQAAAVSNTLAQVAQATAMYQTRRGVVVPASTGRGIGPLLVAGRSLSTLPVNAVKPDGTIDVTDDESLYSSKPAAMTIALLGTDAKARDVCLAIEERAGSSSVTTVTSPKEVGALVAANRRQGCFSYAGMHAAYLPI